ncbi:1-phosphofructokinase family hexose kinase [Hyphomicrobium sp. 99]|uniref:1-phosphofructokinase family hexose kinase n=1 Tax=Hyphomicrobium sp. 99 TaxID=1163419 RepID=UPI0005F76ADD|nr:1-phosphofructokinase family hexose kinase [Hyphomicrobium sp. 99]
MQNIAALTINPAVDMATSVDHVVPVKKLRCATVRRDPGGGGINVARVLHRFGLDATAIYPMGGSIGQLLRRLIDAEGIRSLTIPIGGETRESFAVVEEVTGQQFRFTLPGPQMTEAECRSCFDALASLECRPDFIIASGSLPPGVPEDFYAQVSRLAKERGARFILDTSGPALKHAIGEGAYLIKPNLNELSELMNMTLADQDSCIHACYSVVASGGAVIVALTLGDRGALLVTRDNVWRASAIPIKPVSSVGAGDSFLGAMVWSIAVGHDLQTAFRYGVASGAAALLAPGTELCLRKDVERLYREVSIEAIEVPHRARDRLSKTSQ